MPARLIDIPELRNRVHVFRSRRHAGAVLSEMLLEYRGSDTLIMAIPAGGIPVAVEMGERLGLPVDVVVVSKITFAWNTEAGYGALAFDGTLRLNDALVARTVLDSETVAADVERTRNKVNRRVARLREQRSPAQIAGRSVIVVDDGLASGFTMRVAVEALAKRGAGAIVVTVPTGHVSALEGFSDPVQAVYSANVRGGASFAVADAYEHWSDVSEDDAIRLLSDFPGRSRGGCGNGAQT